MGTRRQKLRDLFEDAVSNGVCVLDLLDSIEAFTAKGESGIERWLDTTKVQHGESLDSPALTLDQAADLKAHLQTALSIVEAV